MIINHKRKLQLIAVFLFVVMLITACSINETEKVSLGAIKVTAYDSTQAIEIEDAVLVLDGVTRNETTPAVLSKITAGQHTLEVRPDPTAYSAKTAVVVVTPPDTNDITINFALVQDPAIVTFTTDQDPATIILNDDYIVDKTTEDTLIIAAGNYSISVYKEGFKTVLPAIENITLNFNQEENLTFSLEEVADGNQVGDRFPDFHFPTDVMVSDTEYDSLSIGQFRGRIVLVNFWFYNCEACRDEFPSIETVYTERSADGFRVLAINGVIGADDTIENFAEFREIASIPTLPLLLNTEGYAFSYEKMGVALYPHNFIVDQSGIIRYSLEAVTYDELNGYIDALLLDE